MIEYVDIEHAQELDAFVTAHQNCHFMQTSLWGRVKKDWGWYGILCRNDSGEIVGSMALLRHDIRFLPTCMLYAPRGPIFTDGDFDTFRALVDGAKQLCKRCGAYILRLDPRLEETETAFVEQATSLGFSQDTASDFSLFQPRCCYVLELAGLTPETLESKYQRSTRYNVHLAQRRGVQVALGGVDDLPDFCRMMAQTAQKNSFEPRTERYFREFLTGMGEHATLYFAQENGKNVAGTITVTLGNRSWHMYGCSDNSCLTNRPNELLQYRMQSDAIKAGCNAFDFRGVEGYPVEGNPKIGLHAYKQGYGADFHAYVGQFDYIVRPLMHKTVRFLQKLYR